MFPICRFVAVLMLVLSWTSGSAYAQPADPWLALAAIANQYMMRSNVTYLTANNWEAKVDLYLPRRTVSTPSHPTAADVPPNPTLIYIHGGGWTAGAKDGSLFSFLPYLAMGFSIVNVDYRLASVSLAPAAVEDCRAALRWVHVHAKEYHFDTARIVVTGHSAGGHLALTTGMLPLSAGFDRQRPGTEDLKVAAIINWYGITDVNDLLDGPNMREYAVTWLGGQTDRQAIARRVSPLSYVRAGLPPILTIHGDADQTVPYAHAVRLHDALSKAGVPNQLITVPGGKHGSGVATPEEVLKLYASIREFLGKYDLLPAAVQKPPTGP
jgi:acetyl esterase/lipase